MQMVDRILQQANKEISDSKFPSIHTRQFTIFKELLTGSVEPVPISTEYLKSTSLTD
jgi:hypothetical protein